MTAAEAGSRTRSERTADSRLLILDAAVACLVEDGYAGASTLAVQARAGVSRGRLLHHFPSRAELLVAAAGHLSTTLLAEVQARAAALMADEPAGRERVDRAIELMWATFQEPPFWAAMELWTAARTDPELKAALRSEERRLRTAIRAVADEIWGPEVAAAPLYAELCELLFTSMRGVAIVYAFEDRPAVTDPHVALWKRLAPGCSRSTVRLTAVSHADSMTRVTPPSRSPDERRDPGPQGRGMTMSDQLAAARPQDAGRAGAALRGLRPDLRRARRAGHPAGPGAAASAASAPATGSPSWRSTAWRRGRPTWRASGSARSSSR